jgi:hypothetical protein
MSGAEQAQQQGLSTRTCVDVLVVLAVCAFCSYPKLAQDVKPGSSILCADGSIVLEVISCNPKEGTVRARCKNTAMLG